MTTSEKNDTNHFGLVGARTSKSMFLAAAVALTFAVAPLAMAPQAAYAVSGGGSDYAGSDISNQDFSNQNYKAKDFTQVIARNTNFVNAILIGCRFQNGYLIDADFTAADLRGVSFERTNMENVILKGPVAIRREIFAKIKTYGKDYCTWDDYNWDWSLVHLMAKEELPFKVLSPGVLQVAHIGLEDGMHTNQKDQNAFSDFTGLTKKQEMLKRMKKYLNKDGKLDPFHNDVDVPHVQRVSPPRQLQKGFGGWGHPADQEHCIALFQL